MKLTEIKPNPNNPRLIKDDKFKKLCKSIEAFPKMMELRPIVVDDEGTILGGNMRYKALQALGYTEIDDEWVKRASDLTEKEKQEFIIKDNNEFGEYDWDVLANNFEVEDLLEWGMDESELKISKEVEEDDVPDVPEEATSKLGEIYQLGDHRLMCGDATKAEDVEKLMDGERADCSFTSPPYNVGHNLGYDKASKYESSNDNIEDYLGLLVKSTMESIKYANDVFVNLQFLANNKKDLAQFMSKMSEWFKDIFFWRKQQVAPAAAMNVANSQTEVIMLFGEDNEIDKKEWVDMIALFGMNITRRWGNKKFRGTFSNMVETKSASGENKNADIHNATMPVALPSIFMQKGYKEGSTVIDLFAGTGTIAIACEQLNHKCYMMELDPKYIDVIIKRWEDFTGDKAVKL